MASELLIHRRMNAIAAAPAHLAPVAIARSARARRARATRPQQRSAPADTPALPTALPAQAERDLGAPAAAPPSQAERDFEQQCLPHRRELYAMALRMTRHPDDAGDLVQETLLRAYLAWSRFEYGSNCRAWLMRILTNSYINIYRRRRRHTSFERDSPGDAVAVFYGDPAPQASTPADLIERSLGDEVTSALASLGDDYRQVVEMADLHGIRYRDIADALGLPMGTVMSRLFRARRKLEEQLGDFAATDYGIRRAA